MCKKLIKEVNFDGYDLIIILKDLVDDNEIKLKLDSEQLYEISLNMGKYKKG